jgi:hypothetical protein
MKKIFAIALVTLFVVTVIYSCKKESETFNGLSLLDYYPLQAGKSYIYRLDSTVTFNFNERLIIKSYQAKDSIESTFLDNEGRLSYRIFRYLRDTSGTRPWQYSNTFFATPSSKQVEYVENNLRFIKLNLPLVQGNSWAGNNYINTKTENTYLDGWEYEYQDINNSYRVLNKTYDNTITVFQQDEFTPDGPFDPTLDYQQRNYSVEVYAKGVGLIYKDFLHWAWQKPKYEDGSYGVRLSLISHN